MYVVCNLKPIGRFSGRRRFGSLCNYGVWTFLDAYSILQHFQAQHISYFALFPSLTFPLWNCEKQYQVRDERSLKMFRNNAFMDVFPKKIISNQMFFTVMDASNISMDHLLAAVSLCASAIHETLLTACDSTIRCMAVKETMFYFGPLYGTWVLYQINTLCSRKCESKINFPKL